MGALSWCACVGGGTNWQATPPLPQVSHSNTAKAAREYGDENLAKLCGLIAADENRHEIAYQRIMEALFERCAEGLNAGDAKF